jgi:hypothetical protein
MMTIPLSHPLTGSPMRAVLGPCLSARIHTVQVVCAAHAQQQIRKSVHQPRIHSWTLALDLDLVLALDLDLDVKHYNHNNNHPLYQQKKSQPQHRAHHPRIPKP